MTGSEHDAPTTDPVTGLATTGHEWDGLTELNNPLPRWWLWIFYATIVWAVGYWIVYPSWPLISSYAGGVFGWHSRTAVVEELDALKAQRGPMVAKLAAAPLAEIEKDPALLDFTLAYGRVAFKENCAPCHGAGGGGATGYPNLIDDDWLWGGTTDAIMATITHGISNADPESRQSEMPAFGREGLLPAAEIYNVAAYVRSLSGLEAPPGADIEAGAKIFADNCVRLSRRERQGQSRARRTQPDRPGLGSTDRARRRSSTRSPMPATARCRPGASGSIRRPSRR